MGDTRLAIPYRQFDAGAAFDVIVIGSGIGGLDVAALLAKSAGRRVLVLERHYGPGGRTQVFHRPGSEWDVGLHDVGQLHTPGSASARDLRPVMPVRNLFLTGQDISTEGVTGALAGAVPTASAMLGRNMFGQIVRAAGAAPRRAAA
jgi:phytoene dehydrogenase-like protein